MVSTRHKTYNKSPKLPQNKHLNTNHSSSHDAVMQQHREKIPAQDAVAPTTPLKNTTTMEQNAPPPTTTTPRTKQQKKITMQSESETGEAVQVQVTKEARRKKYAAVLSRFTEGVLPTPIAFEHLAAGMGHTQGKI